MNRKTQILTFSCVLFAVVIVATFVHFRAMGLAGPSKVDEPDAVDGGQTPLDVRITFTSTSEGHSVSEISNVTLSKGAAADFETLYQRERESFRQMGRRKDAYTRMFSELNLDSETIRRVKELTQRKISAAGEMKRGLLSGTYSSLRAAYDACDIACAEADVELRSLLGENQYIRFLRAEEEEPIRRVLNAYTIYLHAERLGLTEEKHEAMVELYLSSYKKHGVDLFYQTDRYFVNEKWFDAYILARRSAEAEIASRATGVIGDKEADVLRHFHDVQTRGAISLWREKTANFPVRFKDWP